MENIQIKIGEVLVQLGDHGEIMWQMSAIFLIAVLVFLAFKNYYLHTTSISTKRSLFYSSIKSRTFFSFVFILTIIILRAPGLSRLECNVDESMWISGALTLIKDPRFWLSVDGTTSGPLVIYPLILMNFLGGSINYGSVKLLGTLVWGVAALCLYGSFKTYFKDEMARIIMLPFIACVSMFTFSDYVAYNSEHIPILLISLSIFLYSKVETESGSKVNCYTIILGFTLGLVPYSKLQAVPIALAITFLTSVSLILKKDKKLFIYLLLGGLLPSIIILIYLVTFNVFNDFWQTYIISNLVYAKSGLIRPGESKTVTIIGKLLLFPQFVLGVNDTKFYFISMMAIIFILSLVLVKIRKSLLFDEYKLLVMAFLITFASAYSVFQPSDPFSHYVLLLIVPATFLCGTLVGITFEKIRLKELNISRKSGIILISFFVFLSTIIPFSYIVRKGNVAFSAADANVYNGKMKSEVAKKILDYAQQGDRMAIWGWANKYYVETNLAQGTREAHSYYQIMESKLQDYFLKRYVSDIKTNKPIIFIDVVAEKQFRLTNKTTYGHDNYPQIKAVIHEYYTFVAEIDGIRIYQKK